MKLRIENLTVQIKKKVILDQVSFDLQPGIYAVIGANGAGKTTLFRSVLGLQQKQGAIVLEEIEDGAIGYLPQRFETLKNLTVEETMEYFCCLKKVPTEMQEQEIQRVLNLTNLDGERKKLVRKLSGGMHQRLGVAQALLGDSKLLIMDEPTVGLDPRERQNFRTVLKSLQENGKEQIVMISSHETQELERVCQKVIFLHKGKLLEFEEIGVLYEKYQADCLEDVFFKLTDGV